MQISADLHFHSQDHVHADAAISKSHRYLTRSYPSRYNRRILEIRVTSQFESWFSSLKDERARARIDIRIRRLREGNSSDVKAVGRGVSELRLTYGPGYRVYYIQQGNEVIVLLAGGSKKSQSRDIAVAYDLADNL